MKAADWKKLGEKLKKTNKEVLIKVVGSLDGHTIYDPKKFIDYGLDSAIVNAFTKVQHSGSSPKETIYGKDGEVVEELKGVYGLELLTFIASTFDVDSWKIGRGSRADHLIEQLILLFK